MINLLDRLHFTVTLKLESDLHVGTGEVRPLSELREFPEGTGTSTDPDVSIVARDVYDRPIIPATAIKSALRRAMSKAEIDRLFGAPKDEGSGNIGCVWLEAAVVSKAATKCDDLPFWNPDKHSFITTHVAISRKTRTADDQKLFKVERLPAGSEFKLSGEIAGSVEKAKQDLKLLLVALVDGIAVGAEERAGAGRLVACGRVDCNRHWFDPAKLDVASEGFSVDLPAKNSVVVVEQITDFELTCPGPYVSLDMTKNVRNRRGTLRRSKTLPILQPQSLLGALRTRCAWLSHLHCPDGQRGDNPFRPAIAKSEIAKLTSTERLFGVNGWRGLVRILTLEATAGTLHADEAGGDHPVYAGLALDRWTQCPIDGALFATEFFVGATFKVAISLDVRADWPSSDDRTLYGVLIDDVRANGLMLGHSTNSGFGWFETPESLKHRIPVASTPVRADARPQNSTAAPAKKFRDIPLDTKKKTKPEATPATKRPSPNDGPNSGKSSKSKKRKRR